MRIAAILRGRLSPLLSCFCGGSHAGQRARGPAGADGHHGSVRLQAAGSPLKSDPGIRRGRTGRRTDSPVQDAPAPGTGHRAQDCTIIHKLGSVCQERWLVMIVLFLDGITHAPFLHLRIMFNLGYFILCVSLISIQIADL